MAYMDKLKNSKPKKSSEAEADKDMEELLGGEEMGEDEMDALLSEEEAPKPGAMADMSDDDLKAEMERRGFKVEKEEGEEDMDALEDEDFESLA